MFNLEFFKSSFLPFSWSPLVSLHNKHVWPGHYLKVERAPRASSPQFPLVNPWVKATDLPWVQAKSTELPPSLFILIHLFFTFSLFLTGDSLNFQARIRKKDNLSDFERSVVVGIKRSSLDFSEIAPPLRFAHETISCIHRGSRKKRKHPVSSLSENTLMMPKVRGEWRD